MVAAVAAGRGWPYFDPEYETLNARINPPKVVIDNKACETATIIKLDSLNRHGILLEVVQVLADLDLSIRKAYISSDGGWFMDVFHVTDQQGNKLTDEVILGHIEQSLGEKGSLASALLPTAGCGRHIGVQSLDDYTALELTGTDRPGLLADVSAALAELGCNVAAAEVWTHRMRVACMLYITDAEDPAGGPLPPEGDRLRLVQRRLLEVMAVEQQSHQQEQDAATATKAGDFTAAMAGQITHTERRLHQMMQADGDYYYEEEEEEDQPAVPCSSSPPSMSSALAFSGSTAAATAAACKRPTVTVRNCVEKGYSVVNVQCMDRPKLLFDTVCTLTDMQYVVFHATIDCDGPYAYQEYYIRHVDGSTLKLEAERQRVVRCLEAAISRRAPQGVRLELSTKDKLGLLSEVTRIFSENKLSVSRAEVSTRGEVAVNVFYVTDAEGGNVDPKVLEAVRQRIGYAVLQVKEEPVVNPVQRQAAEDDGTATRLASSLGSFFRSHSERLLYSLGLIKSCS